MKRNKIFSILMMLVIVLGTAVAMSSCGKDDDNSKGGDNSLIGTWISDRTSQKITFRADGTYFATDFSDEGREGRYTYDETNAILTLISEDVETDTFVFRIKVQGNLMTMIDIESGETFGPFVKQ